MDIKYINTYVDIVMKMVHDNLTESIQHKTQIKMLNDLIQEKDEVINRLSKESQESDKNKQAAVSWESQYNAMKNKAGHVDALTNQVNDMKHIIQEKDNKINNLEEQIKSLSTPKINKRKKPKDVPQPEIDVTTDVLPLNMQVTSTETGPNDF